MVLEAIIWTIVLGLTCAEAGSIGDQCDWTGSYLDEQVTKFNDYFVAQWLEPEDMIKKWCCYKVRHRTTNLVEAWNQRLQSYLGRKPSLLSFLEMNDLDISTYGTALESGLTSNTERGVTPVYLRCREGTVSWVYPRGALRLLFRPPLPAEEREFRVCVRVIRRPDPPELFHEEGLGEPEAPERFPARLFVEGAHRLVPLYAPDDGDPKELRCFRSRKGRAALYVEAEPEEGTRRREATFKYEARPLARRHYDPSTADCRPCSEAELELAFCTSDLVSRGVFIGTEQREDLDTTQLTMRLTKLIRATAHAHDDRKDQVESEEDGDYFRYEVDNTLERTTHRNRRGRRARSLHAHVHVPAACGATAGAGEFLVMATRRLGRYSMVCAPRLDQWADVVRKRNADGTAHCLLQH